MFRTPKSNPRVPSQFNRNKHNNRYENGNYKSNPFAHRQNHEVAIRQEKKRKDSNFGFNNHFLKLFGPTLCFDAEKIGCVNQDTLHE